MQLDFRSGGELSVEDSMLIDIIAPRVQEEYSKFIGQLISENKLSELELLLSVISRNPFHSSVLPVLCKALLLEKKLERGDEVTSIIVENAPISAIIYSILDRFNRKIPVKIGNGYLHNSLFFTRLIKVFKSIYWIIISWLWPRLSGIYKAKPNTSIVFVDNFIFPNSFNKSGQFIERYYSGYDQYLNNEQRQKIWYSPTLYGFKTLGQCLKMSAQSKESQQNFIFQESWLTLGNYLKALHTTMKLPNKILITPTFMGIDIRQLLIYEARKDIFSPSLVMAICKYYFIKKIKEANVAVCQVVDWSENQTIDKALNLGFHKYYPNTVVKGYQGYVSPLYETHKIPQPFELDSLILPDQLYVISERYKGVVLDSCPSLDVRLASAFRFSYLYNVNRDKFAEQDLSILIALPMDINESIGILQLCTQLPNILDGKVRILVKHHPAHNSQEFAKKVPAFLDEAFTQTQDSMFHLLETISLLISSASSACAEAKAVGIPVAIYGNRCGVTMNPIPNEGEGPLGNIFYSWEQLVDLVECSLRQGDVKMSVEQYFFMDKGQSARRLFVCE